MLRRMILIALPLVAAEAPKPLSDADRVRVLTSQQRLLVAHARKVEAQLAVAQAEQFVAELMKAHQSLVAAERKKAGAADACELDMEAKWQCDTSRR